MSRITKQMLEVLATDKSIKKVKIIEILTRYDSLTAKKLALLIEKNVDRYKYLYEHLNALQKSGWLTFAKKGREKYWSLKKNIINLLDLRNKESLQNNISVIKRNSKKQRGNKTKKSKRITKESNTADIFSNGFAQLSKLELNNKNSQTPLIFFTWWFGKQNPEIWNSMKINGLLVNAYNIIKYNLFDELNGHDGIHDWLNFDGHVMCDSGGFQLINNQLELTQEKIMQIQEKIKPDIAVCLDYPLKSGFSVTEKKERLRKTIENVMKAVSINDNGLKIMPVLHIDPKNLDDTKKIIQKIKSIDAFNMFGLGSLVHKFMYGKSRNFRKALEIIYTVRQNLPEDAHLHVMGVSSTLLMYFLFFLGVDSVDSIGWAKNAAFGRINLLGTGAKHVQNLKNDLARGLNCKCPICIKGDSKSLIERWGDRAIHNAWVYLKEIELMKNAIKADQFGEFIYSRVKTNPEYNNLFEYLIQLS